MGDLGGAFRRLMAHRKLYPSGLARRAAPLKFLAAAAAIAGLLGLLPQAGIAAGATASADNPDAQLLAVYRLIGADRHQEALQQLDRILQRFPNFRLAHLIRGDLLAARSRPITTIGDAPGAPRDQLMDLREEALLRLRGLKERPPPGTVPRALLQLSPDQKTALVVDPYRARLYVYENVNGRPKFLTDFYISVGKLGIDKVKQGDQKTPLGVYFVTGSIPRTRLTDLYGVGALPINYPNEWDQRLGKTGNGIWLHGVPSNTYSRAPKSSDGCVVLSNQDLQTLFSFVQTGSTPVVVAEHAEWVKLDRWEQERAGFMRAFQAWRTDWESGGFERYVRHYSQKFSAEGLDAPAWLNRRRVYFNHGTRQVRTDNVSIFRYPAKHEMIYVTFDQTFSTDGTRTQLRKRQYWLNEGGHWRIVYEHGTALPGVRS